MCFNFVQALTELNPNGNFRWAHFIGKGLLFQPIGMDYDIYSNLYITGAGGDTIQLGQMQLSSLDVSGSFYIGQFDSTGNCIWATHETDYGYQWASGIKVSNKGNIFLGGEYHTDFDLGAYYIPHYSAKDIFIGKYDLPTLPISNSIEKTPPNNIKYTIAPNPTTNIINLSTTEFEIESYRIYDMNGQLILFKTVPQTNNVIIELDGLPASTYILDINNGKWQSLVVKM